MIGYRIWQIAGWTMLHYLWVGAALGAAAIVLRFALRRAAANVRYVAALCGLLMMAAAPAVIAAVVAHRLGPPPSDIAPAGMEQVHGEMFHAIPREMPASRIGPVEPLPPLPDDDKVAGTLRVPSATQRIAEVIDAGVQYLPWLWLLGSPIALLLTTVGMAGAERLRRQSRPVEDAAIAELCRRLATALGISRRVGVAVCDRIAGPVLVGIVRPVILLPAVALAGWDPQQLEMVLLHELLHVRRWDNLVNLLQRIVESLLFFHPMIWIVSAWIRREREHCCDAVVIAHTRQPQAYARLLVALAEQVSRNPLTNARPAYPQVVSSMAQPSLVARIRRILKKEEQSMQVSRKTLVLMLATFTAAALLIGGYCSSPKIFGRENPADSAEPNAGPAPATTGGPPAKPSATEHIARARAALRKCMDDNATGDQRQFTVDSDQALAECNKALQIDPKSTEAYSVRGHSWAFKYEYRKAIADLDKALAINPKLAEAYSYRGDAWRGLDDFDKALADCDKALVLDPKLAEAYFTRGMVFTLKHDHDKAITEFRRVLAIAPERPYTLNNLGVTCWKLAQKQDFKAAEAEAAGDMETAKACRKKSTALKDEAMAYWQRGVASNPKYVDIHSNLGYFYSERNDLEKAEFHLRKAVEIKGVSPRPHNNLGRVLLRESQVNEAAAREAEGKGKTDPADAAKAKQLGAQAKAKLDEAIAQFERAVELDPALVEARLNLGEVYTQLRRFDDAATQYRKILDLDKPSVVNRGDLANFSQAYFGLARIALATDKPDEALAYLKRSTVRNPNNLVAGQFLAKLHYGRGEYAEGEKCLQSYLAKLPPAVRQRWAAQLIEELDDAGHHEAAAKARAAAKLPEANTREPAAPKASDTSAKTSAAKPAIASTDFVIFDEPPVDKTTAAAPATNQKLPAALTYSGKVVDADTGKPIEGATVAIMRSIFSMSDVRPRVLQTTKHRTAADGTYTFTIPPEQLAQPGLYLSVPEISHPRYATSWAGGYGLSLIREDEKRGQRPFFTRLTLAPGEEISGTVLTPEGKPAAGIAVIANSQGANGQFGWLPSVAKTVTDEHGVFRVNVMKGGSGYVTILPKQYAPSGHLLKGPGDQGRFVLQKGTVLQGRVLDAAGNPLKGVWINAAMIKSAFVPDKGLPAPGQLHMVQEVGGDVRRAALSDEKGEFKLSPLPPGQYRVVPWERSEDPLNKSYDKRPLPAVFVGQDVALREGEPMHEVEIRAVPQVSIELQWLDSTGKPCKGYEIRCTGKLPASSEPYFTSGPTDASGKTIALAPKGLRDATLDLSASAVDVLRWRKARGAPLSAERRVVLGTLNADVRGITVIRYRAPVLLIKAVATDGKPIKNFKPKAVYPDGVIVRDPRSRWVTGVEGDVFFVPLPDGRWHSEQLLPGQEFTLTLEAPGYQSNSQQLKLPEGAEKDLTVSLKPVAAKTSDSTGNSSPAAKSTERAPSADEKPARTFSLFGASSDSPERGPGAEGKPVPAAGKLDSAHRIDGESIAVANSAAKPAETTSDDKAKPSKVWTAAEKSLRDGVGKPPVGPAAHVPADLLALPGYGRLGRPDTRRHYGIDAAQEKKLREISAAYLAEQGKFTKVIKESEILPPQQRKAKLEELNGERKAVRKKIDDVLTAAQKAAYKHDLRCDLVLGLVDDPTHRVGGRLAIELGQEQKQQMERLLEEFIENSGKRIQSRKERLLAVLTPQQREQLAARFTDADVAAPSVYVPPDVGGLTNGVFTVASQPLRPFDFVFASKGGASVVVYSQLVIPAVRKELALTADQEAKLRAIQTKSQAAALGLFDRYEPKAAATKPSPDKQKSQQAEYQRALEKLGKEVVGQIEAVLQPRQIAALTAIVRKDKETDKLLRQDRAVLDDLHATARQRAKLQQIFTEFTAPDYSLQRARGAKVLPILTSDQRKKLDEAVEQYGL